MPRDVLDDLLIRVRKATDRKKKQAQIEAEAKARVERKREIEELNAAFDAERFRFLVATLSEFKGMDIMAIRKRVDDAIEQSIIREANAQRRAARAE
jgi:hypothetical protein